MKSTFALAAVVTATSFLSACTVLPPAGPPPTGNWSGNTTQGGVSAAHKAYVTKITLNGLAGGSIDYPSLRCGGRLVFAHMHGTTAMYKEQLTAGRRFCVDNGIVSIAPMAGTGDVYFLWRLDGNQNAGVLTPVKY